MKILGPVHKPEYTRSLYEVGPFVARHISSVSDVQTRLARALLYLLAWTIKEITQLANRTVFGHTASHSCHQ